MLLSVLLLLSHLCMLCNKPGSISNTHPKFLLSQLWKSSISHILPQRGSLYSSDTHTHTHTHTHTRTHTRTHTQRGTDNTAIILTFTLHSVYCSFSCSDRRRKEPFILDLFRDFSDFTGKVIQLTFCPIDTLLH